MKSHSAALMAALCFSLLILLLISSAKSFYYCRVPPRDSQRGDPLDVQVKKLSSLSEVIQGDHIQNSMNSMYTFNMMEEHPCKVLSGRLGAESANNFKEKIRDGHRVNLHVELRDPSFILLNYDPGYLRLFKILDNLPVVVRHSWDGSESTTTYTHGFPVGFTATYAGSKEVKYFIYNHLSFRVMFHKHLANDSAQIVGFEVTPHRFGTAAAAEKFPIKITLKMHPTGEIHPMHFLNGKLFCINHQYIYKDYKKLMIITCGEQKKHIIRSGSVGPQEVDAHKLIILTYDVSFVATRVTSKGNRVGTTSQRILFRAKRPCPSNPLKSVQAVVNVAWP